MEFNAISHKLVLLSGAKRSEKDRVLPRRNSGETQFGRDAIRASQQLFLFDPKKRQLIKKWTA
ncbi:hypothetical protein FXV91_14690 [Methanosarcina sp. DH2]|nr:hypothetical protein [Methanosarcina sp. DH2]